MSQTPTRYEALKMVRDKFETEQAMAEAFGVTQPTVWRWLNQSKQLPEEHVLHAETALGIPRHWLRPDIYPMGLPATGDRFYGVDLSANRVSFQRSGKMKSAAA